MTPEPDSHQSEESRLKAQMETYAAAASAPTAQKRGSSSEPERSKFALILSELDERSKKSNQWLTGVSVAYVAAVVFLVAILYLRYSDVGRAVGQLEQQLDETEKAIAKQASIHRDQSQKISERIASAGVVLDGLGNEWQALEVELDDGKKRANELIRESDNLKIKIAKIDSLLDQLSKRAEPFYIHYAIDPDKPLKFGRGNSLDIAFDDPKVDPLFAASENVERNGKYLAPSNGTFMVTGWFAIGEPEDVPDQIPIVKTEIRVDGETFWSGMSYGTGVFTSGVPLRRGQTLSIHATVRHSGESDPPSGSIDRGEIRIARLYYSPE